MGSPGKVDHFKAVDAQCVEWRLFREEQLHHLVELFLGDVILRAGDLHEIRRTLAGWQGDPVTGYAEPADALGSEILGEAPDRNAHLPAIVPSLLVMAATDRPWGEMSPSAPLA